MEKNFVYKNRQNIIYGDTDYKLHGKDVLLRWHNVTAKTGFGFCKWILGDERKREKILEAP